MKYLFSFIFLTAILLSCNEKSASNAQTAADNNSSQSEVQQQNTQPQFQSIPQDLAMKVWNEVDLIDFIFHNLPFSMSQDQQGSIRANVTYISQEIQPFIPEGCTPIARQFYGAQGDIFMEADVYFSENCQFYVFIIDGQPRYANKMTPEGKNFFNTMISQAMNATKNVQ